MNFKFKIYCSLNYFGPTCGEYCVEQNSDVSGHYTCNNKTGVKVCRPGELSVPQPNVEVMRNITSILGQPLVFAGPGHGFIYCSRLKSLFKLTNCFRFDQVLIVRTT